jgi:hypothetical protein
MRLQDQAGAAADGVVDGAPAMLVRAIPGGRISRSQARLGDRLCQNVEIRRPDGSVWNAYARELPLPAEPEAAARLARTASSVLGLAMDAVAAADTARLGRCEILRQQAATPSWGIVRYG